jgi:hypothetical protein
VTDLDEIIDLLDRTPRVAGALLTGIPESWAAETDTPGGWRPKHVVGHLVSGEINNWMPRVERILTDGTSKAFDSFDRFEMLERDVDMPLDALLIRFSELRAQSLMRLRKQVTSPADLDRTGLHPALGEVTLRQLLETWTVHDLDHLAQAFSSMAASRDAAVGPWKAYLGILLRRDDPAAVPG